MTRLYVDAHLHLQDPRFSGHVETLIGQAEGAGIGRMFCNAVSEPDWPAVAELSRRHAAVVPFFGIHPWCCGAAGPGWQKRLADRLAAMTAGPAGIGETGLDRARGADTDAQRRCLLDHLELAAAHNLPVSIHCVKAWGALLEILETFTAGQELPRIMVHSFSGSVETMRRLIDHGCTISYSCSIAQAGRNQLRETVKRTPLTALLLETDSPYQKCPDLGPVSYYTADHNEPVAVAALYRYTAELLNMDIDELSSQLSTNAAIFTNQTADR